MAGLKKISNDSWMYTNNGYTHYTKGIFSYDEFKLLLKEREGRDARYFFLINRKQMAG